MVAAVRVPIQPETLRWARSVMGVSRDETARAAGTHAERVAEWEAGAQNPTFNQLKAVAKRLDRTTAFFFLPPPEDSGIPDAPDYRGAGDKPASTTLLREMKRAETYRDFYIEVMRKPEPPPPLQPITWSNIEFVARDLRKALHARIPPSTGAPDLSSWIDAVEAIGILVFQTSGVELTEFRGASIYHELLPVILLNGADSNRGRIFSLFHEIAHLANRSSALCLNLEREGEEVLCNRFSAEFLMPRKDVERIVQGHRRSEYVAALVKAFGTSELAAAVRLRALELISQEDLEEVRDASDARWEAERRRQASRPGFVPHWQLRYRNLGHKYLRAVVSALEEERIGHLDATYMLDAKVPTIERMREELHVRGFL